MFGVPPSGGVAHRLKAELQTPYTQLKTDLIAELPLVTPPLDAVFNWIALAPDGTRLAGVDGGGGVSFYQLARPGDLTQAKFLRRERAHHDHGRAVAFSPDGRLLASGAEHVVLWNAETLKRAAVLEHTSIVWHVAFSPDGRWLVSTHGDGSLLIWNVAERTRAANLNEHSGPVRAVAIAEDGKHIASASEDRSIIIWNIQTSSKEAVLSNHETRINYYFDAASFTLDPCVPCAWQTGGNRDCLF